jgi:hypothetical protein
MALQDYQQNTDVTKRITVTLDDEIHDWIAIQAERNERTVPNYLAWLARKIYLEHQDNQDSTPNQNQSPTKNPTK